MFPKPERRAGWRNRPRKKIGEGRIGAGNRAFASRMMAEWRSRLGPRLACVESGQSGQLVVGHIEDRSLEPSRRWDRLNVAPLAWHVNSRMKTDLVFRAAVQDKMRAWVARHMKGGK